MRDRLRAFPSLRRGDLDRPGPRRSVSRAVLACETLDGRQLLSTMALHVPSVRLSAAEIARSDASDAAFGTSVTATLRAGVPVAERVTTAYFDGSTQTESLVKVPDLSGNTITTTKTIDLRHGGGAETVVDVEAFSGGTTPFSGTGNTHTITTTLPDGAIRTEADTETIRGPKTFIEATIHEAGGGVETWTGVNTRHGKTTVSDRTITEPDGVIEHQKTTTTGVGALDSTSRSTTTSPGAIQISSSATDVTRVQPPASSSSPARG